MTGQSEIKELSTAEAVEEDIARQTKAANLLNDLAVSIDAHAPRFALADLTSFVQESVCPDATEEGYARLRKLAEALGPDSWLGWFLGVQPPITMQGMILVWSLNYAPQIHPLCATEKLPFPFTPLVRAWLDHQPRLVEPSPAHKRNVMPAKLAMAREESPRTGKFAPAAHIVVQPTGGQLVMPGFERATYPDIALPLELWRIGGGEETSPGRGVPWSLRMFVAAILCIPLEERHGRHPLTMQVSLKELVKWLYPNSNPPGKQTWWKRFLEAVAALHNHTARIPYRRGDTGTLGARQVVSVPEYPASPDDMAGPVIFQVWLPPGSERGPQVSSRLMTWGARDAAGFRLLLNLAYRWHNPGRTLRPAGPRADGRGDFWITSRNPNDYDKLTDDDLMAYAFPCTARKNKRNIRADTRNTLKRLVEAGEIGYAEGRYVPPTVIKHGQ